MNHENATLSQFLALNAQAPALYNEGQELFGIEIYPIFFELYAQRHAIYGDFSRLPLFTEAIGQMQLGLEIEWTDLTEDLMNAAEWSEQQIAALTNCLRQNNLPITVNTLADYLN